MPNLNQPGVYIEEIPSGARTINGVSTAKTAFVGRAKWGPVNQPTKIINFGEFERTFGGLWKNSQLGYSIRDFFLNGGENALIVRLSNDASTSKFTLRTTKGSSSKGIELFAKSPGSWGQDLRITVKPRSRNSDSPDLLDLIIELPSAARTEFHTVSLNPRNKHFIERVLDNSSELVEMGKTSKGVRTNSASSLKKGKYKAQKGSGTDGLELTEQSFIGSTNRRKKEGLYALDREAHFNLLVIPPYTSDQNVDGSVLNAAAAYCEDRRAFLIVDPPNTWQSTADAASGINNLGTSSVNAAIYFPRMRQEDPLNPGTIETVPPSGIIAGVYARTDLTRGVWKAPAGTEATMLGIVSTQVVLTDNQISVLNPLGINGLKNISGVGDVVWGSRTLGSSISGNQDWKYVPVRRTALYIEESIDQGTQWVVFEPNEEPLWNTIKLAVGNFLNNLWRQGAFQGAKPAHGFFVRCGLGETMTQADIDDGRIIIEIGFAPLKPAEFIVIQIAHRLNHP